MILIWRRAKDYNNNLKDNKHHHRNNHNINPLLRVSQFSRTH